MTKKREALYKNLSRRNKSLHKSHSVYGYELIFLSTLVYETFRFLCKIHIIAQNCVSNRNIYHYVSYKDVMRNGRRINF